VDGGALGEIEFENFNAAGAVVRIAGRNIHPGSAKDKMVNSQLIAMEFQSLLPAAQRPEHTEGYEEFFHLIAMEGSVESTTLRYIIRDHDMEKFVNKKEMMENICNFLNNKYGKNTVCLEISDSYFNMRSQIEPHMHIVERAVAAMEQTGVAPKIVPIRGGTDGAKLSFMGLPCPNICTGGQNFHGKFEYIPVEDMEKVVEILVAILEQ
jgi:tripeptide aminopeptidase